MTSLVVGDVVARLFCTQRNNEQTSANVKTLLYRFAFLLASRSQKKKLQIPYAFRQALMQYLFGVGAASYFQRKLHQKRVDKKTAES